MKFIILSIEFPFESNCWHLRHLNSSNPVGLFDYIENTKGWMSVIAKFEFNDKVTQSVSNNWQEVKSQPNYYIKGLEIYWGVVDEVKSTRTVSSLYESILIFDYWTFLQKIPAIDKHGWWSVCAVSLI